MAILLQVSDLPDSEGKASTLYLLDSASEVACHSVKCSFDVADTSSKVAAFGSIMSCYSWLHLKALSDDTKDKLLNYHLNNIFFGSPAAELLAPSEQG